MEGQEPKIPETNNPSLSAQQIQQLIDKGIADGLAKAKADEEAAKQKTADDAKVAEAAKKTESTWPYGNLDKDEKFDLSELTKLSELPDDKVLVVHPVYNKNGRGERTSIDLKSSTVQPYDPADYKERTKTDKNTGSSIFQMISLEVIPVHDPTA